MALLDAITAATLTTAPRCLPRSFVSKNGLACELQLLADDGQRLVDMYLAFQPRNCFQGLPPIKDAVCIKWVQDMLRTGVHVMAVSAAAEKGTGPVHRRPYRPVPHQPGEMRDAGGRLSGFQNVGIGTELVRTCIDLADELGFGPDLAPRGRHQRAGKARLPEVRVRVRSNRQGREMDMACEVRRHLTVLNIVPPAAAPVLSLDLGQGLDADCRIGWG